MVVPFYALPSQFEMGSICFSLCTSRFYGFLVKSKFTYMIWFVLTGACAVSAHS